MNQQSSDVIKEMLHPRSRKSPATEILQDIHESGLISRVELEIFESVPIVGPVINLVRQLGKTGLSVQSWFLEQKILRFVEGVEEIPIHKREEFANQFESDLSSQQELTSTLMVILDRYDHLDKPYLLAKILKGRVNNQIDQNTFWRLATEIDRAFVQDLYDLLGYFSADSSRSVDFERLVSCGLATQFVVSDNGDILIGPSLHVPSDDARVLAKLVLEAEYIEKAPIY